MLERARGCVEHGSRQLFNITSSQTQQRALPSSFWSHGSGDVDLSAYWVSLLNASAQHSQCQRRNPKRDDRQLLASLSGSGSGRVPGILEFLYPAKTLQLLHRFKPVNPRAALRRTRSRLPSRTRYHVAHSSESEARRDTREGLFPAETFVYDNGQNSLPPPGLLARQADSNDNNALLSASPDSSSSLHRLSSSNVPATDKSATAALEGSGQDLSRALKQYKQRYQRFSRLCKKLSIDSTDVKSTGNAATEARALLQLGEQATQSARSYIQERLLADKDVRRWGNQEWAAATAVLDDMNRSRQDLISVFEEGFNARKADAILPHLTESLLKSQRDNLKSIVQLIRLFDKWTQSLPTRHRQSPAPFWTYLKRSGSLTTEELAHRALRLIPEIEKLNSDGSPAQVESDLLRAVIYREDFGNIDRNLAEKIYLSLRERLQQIPTYDVLHGLLKKILFLHSRFRDSDGAMALSIFRTMSRFGGYHGERDNSPDLARKLFWRLAKKGNLSQVKAVFDDLVRRDKDYASEYSYMLAKLSQAGRQVEFEQMKELFETRVTDWRAGNRRVGTRAKMDICLDMLLMYRARYDTHAMVQLFDTMSQDEETKPDVRAYNLIIDAYARCEDQESAYRWLSRLKEDGKQPDINSILPFMSEAARNGNTEAVRELTKTAEGLRLPLLDEVVVCHLRALLNSGALTDAKDLLFRSLQFQVSNPIVLWENLIGAYAIRGDRQEVSSLLMSMKKLGYEPNDRIIAHQLRMWCSRGRPAKAQEYLEHILRTRLNPPPAFWFAIVMKGWIDLKKPEQVIKVQTLYSKTGQDMDWSMKQLLAKAVDQLRSKGRNFGPEITQILSAASTELSDGTYLDAGPFLQNNLDRTLETFSTAYFQFLVSVAPGQSELERTQSAWNAYQNFMELKKEAAPDYLPPIYVLTRLMKAYRGRKDWRDLDQGWQLAYRKARELIQDRHHAKKATFAGRSMLNYPLYTYLQGIADQGKIYSEGISLVEKLQSEGFLINNRCWNLIVQLMLASSMQHQEAAFKTAERELMTGWQGWPAGPLKPRIPRHTLRNKLLHYLRVGTQRVADSDHLPGFKVLRPSVASPSLEVAQQGGASPKRTKLAGEEKAGQAHDGFAFGDELLRADMFMEPQELLHKNKDPRYESGGDPLDSAHNNLLKQITDQTKKARSDKTVSANGGSEGLAPETTGVRDKFNDTATPVPTTPLQMQSISQRAASREEGTADESKHESERSLSLGLPTLPRSAAPATPVISAASTGQTLGRLQQDEPLRVRRPEYRTLVLLTRAFLDMRAGAAFDERASQRIRTLSRIAPTVVQAILTMPKVDDPVQLSILRN